MLESPLASPAPAVSASSPARPALLSIATAIPTDRLSTAELAGRLGVSEDWIVSRTGVRERPIAREDELLYEYSAAAGRRALELAGTDAADVDLVLVATMTPDHVTPNAAPLVAHALGATGAGAFDVGAACTAWLSGISTAAAHVESGRARCALVVGADFISRVTDWNDKRTAPLFADAAGAVVVGPARDGVGSVGPVALHSDGAGAPSIQCDHTERKVRMDGPEVYRHAVARMTEATVEAVELAGLSLDDVDLFVYHQANARITQALGERLGLHPERVVDCIERLGNSSAATLPLGLDTAARDGRLRPGSKVLLCAFGAGFTWGAGVVEWGGAPRG